jgi:hypothetical protein
MGCERTVSVLLTRQSAFTPSGPAEGLRYMGDRRSYTYRNGQRIERTSSWHWGGDGAHDQRRGGSFRLATGAASADASW